MRSISNLKRRPRIHITSVIVAALFVITGIQEGYAEGQASVSSTAGRPNAVFVGVPNDPCAALLGNMPPFYRNLTLQFGPVDLDTRKLFLLKCNEKKDELIGTIQGSIDDLKRQAQQTVQTAVDKARDDLVGGFWKFVSEKMLEQLPPDERAKYAPGSPEVLANAHRWLNEAPEEEFNTYVAAYFSQGGQADFIYEAYRAYIDLTNGESRTMIDEFRGVLDRARARLDQVLNANRQVDAAAPDTPTGDILENVGLSGRWVDNFKSYEGRIRDFDKTWKVSEALTIMQGAFETDVPHKKVRAFFELMNTMSSLASDSKIPLVSVVGDIIGSYAQIANQTLDAVLALGEAIKKRHGYCLGLGVATDDPRSDYFANQDILACPLALGTWPFQHIYEAQEKDSGKLFFWNGKSFTPAENGSGKAGVRAAIRLIEGAGDLGYAVTKDSKDHVALVGEVYNTAHTGGVPGLFEEAHRIVSSLRTMTNRFADFAAASAACSSEQVLESLQTRTGVSIENFKSELEDHGSDRLIMTIAASFVALEGRLGGGSRGNAFQTYFEAEEKLAGTSLLLLDGKVIDQNRNPIPGAYLGIKISSGEEPRGCEAWQTNRDGSFTAFAIGDTPGLAIRVTAETGDTRSREETFDLAYFRRVGRDFTSINGAIFARAPGEIILQIEGPEIAQPNEPNPQPGPGTGENGGQEPEPGSQLAELCAIHEARLSEALDLLAAGQTASGRMILFELINSPCGTVAARVAEAENGIQTTIAETVAAARNAAVQCNPQVISTAAQSLDSSAYPEVTAVQAELSDLAGRVTTAINVFDSARTAYHAGDLGQARSRLEQAQQLFSQFGGTPDCANYLSRVATGFERLATLEQALGNADTAIANCDVRLITAYQSRFEELAGKHVSIAAKASVLKSTAVNISSVSQLIESATLDQNDGRMQQAADKASRTLTILDGALNASNCTDLRAQLNTLLAQQVAQNDASQANCETLTGRLEQAASHATEGAFDTALAILSGADPLMTDPAMIKGCDAMPERFASLTQRVTGMVGLLASAEDAIEVCDVARFDALSTQLAASSNNRLIEAASRIESARESCREEDEPSQQTTETQPVPDTDVSEGMDGSWSGNGTLPLTAAGERIVIAFQINFIVSGSKSDGNVIFYNEGEAIGTFPISGKAQAQRVFHEDKWVFEGLEIPNSFAGRISGEGAMTGEGYLTLPEIGCMVEGIAEAVAGAAAGALGAFTEDEEDGGDAPCPFTRYQLNWDAQQQ